MMERYWFNINNMYWYNRQLIDSENITVSITDPGLLYGATVFTTLRVWQQSLEHPLSFWFAHCNRLRNSVAQLGWPEPDWHDLRHGADHLAPRYPVLRITLFPDGRNWITGHALPTNLAQWQQEGVSAWITTPEVGRSLPSHKTGNYLACWLAGQIARSHACQDAILTDGDGNWLETSTGNLWGWLDGCWWTPPLNQGHEQKILAGIGRSHLIQVLKWHNIGIQETIWTPDCVSHFKTLLYTNSVRHIVPIAQVCGNTKAYEKAQGLGKNENNKYGARLDETSSIGNSSLRYNPNHPRLQELARWFRSVL